MVTAAQIAEMFDALPVRQTTTWQANPDLTQEQVDWILMNGDGRTVVRAPKSPLTAAQRRKLARR